MVVEEVEERDSGRGGMRREGEEGAGEKDEGGEEVKV